ncbi:MAG: DUF1891 domain-containing protein [Desulfobacteraceae bacterium]|nr:MAG: DUF1891 domain-containing protein [Desulfobacteraceae bacterium]
MPVPTRLRHDRCLEKADRKPAPRIRWFEHSSGSPSNRWRRRACGWCSRQARSRLHFLRKQEKASARPPS